VKQAEFGRIGVYTLTDVRVSFALFAGLIPACPSAQGLDALAPEDFLAGSVDALILLVRTRAGR